MNTIKRRPFFLTICALLVFFLFVTNVRPAPRRGLLNQVQDHYRDPRSPLKPNFLYDDPNSIPESDEGPVLDSEKRRLSKESLRQLRNDTLGFGNIQVINVKERTDRLDALRLTSSLLGFSFDAQTAVNGADVSPKILTNGFANEKPGHGAVGAWQSHMEAARNMIEKKIATSLILQDDADFDVTFRSQLELFALGSQTLLDTPKGSTPFSPYGDDWDVLWLGHCASSFASNDSRRFLIKNDPTVAPPSHWFNWGDIPDMSPYDNSTRVVYFNAASICLFGHALSLHGAQKVLKYLSMDIFNRPVDIGMMQMCNDPKRKFKCISVFPQLIADHRPAGNKDKDSDIIIPEPGGDVRQQGFTNNIVHSARLNAEALMDRNYDAITSQWPNETLPLKGPVVIEYRTDSEPKKPT